ncbi:unnamed protein product [Eretmochelys imbricata]
MSPLCLGVPTHPGSGVRQPRGIRPLCQGAGPVLPYPSPREDSDPLSPGRPLPPEQRPCPGWEPPASRNSRPSSAVSWGKRRRGGSREVGGLGSGGSPGGLHAVKRLPGNCIKGSWDLIVSSQICLSFIRGSVSQKTGLQFHLDHPDTGHWIESMD